MKLFEMTVKVDVVADSGRGTGASAARDGQRHNTQQNNDVLGYGIERDVPYGR